MENTKDKGMTIDKLAMMVAKGFDSIEKTMVTKEGLKESLKEGLNNLEEKMNTRFEGIHKRIDDISINRVKYEDHNALKKRVSILEKV